MSGAYGPICGVVVSGRRCYALGHNRYNGRCKEHELAANDRGAAPLHRCGWLQTDNGHPCSKAVARAGDRCGMHTPQKVVQIQAHRGEALAERFAQLERKRARLEKKRAQTLAVLKHVDAALGPVRAELARIRAVAEQPMSEAAE